ncbi:mannitol-1-phosphate 5-dehydrogenase [Parafrigoribacterium soli]|uniref:mannitol-1-phosphate 5-dehydrogenase n=1 Tax=Parafrigoribacterium soli TaxID=3144663 RepID=UPI0032EC0F5E
MKAVHFGAGNIGRGFIGLVLHDAGYEVVFADVDAAVIDALASTPSYEVHEVGNNPRTRTVSNYRALNSGTNEADVVAEIATADIVTTAVGPSILRFVAPLIAAGIAERDASLPALQVMACENAISATDLLRAEVQKSLETSGRTVLIDDAIFANTAVDRIVPAQDRGDGLDVTVEEFFEWAIESGPFGGALPVIPDAHFVDDLAPYIERKLFTVNTGHATLAYHGFLHGAATIAEAMRIPEVLTEVQAVLSETKELLVAKHEFESEVQQAYIRKNLARFANPYLPDTPERVGRSPLRKLSRHERFIRPALGLAEQGVHPAALLRAIGAALRFDMPGDAESVSMLHQLGTLSAEVFTTQVTGLEPGDAIYADVVAVVRDAQS